MYECLNLFSEPTKAWFKHAFSRPTEVQQQVWPAIHSGENVLVVAPTGSGKTLCAFLSALDRLMAGGTRSAGVDVHGEIAAAKSHAEQKAAGKGSRKKTKRGVKVLYISPLKALGADVAKNLELPLQGISQQYEAMELPIPDVEVAMRSGDSTPEQRQPSAGYSRHHAGITIPAAHLQGEQHIDERGDGDRRRDSCGRRYKTRRAPRCQPRTP